MVFACVLSGNKGAVFRFQSVGFFGGSGELRCLPAGSRVGVRMGRTYLRQFVDNVQGVGQQRQDVGFLAIGGGLTPDQVEQAVFDYLLFGDVAILKIRNVFGEVIDLLPLPSLYLRCRKDGTFAVLQEGPALIYDPEDIVFFKMYDPRQQVYGLPDYIGGIHSVLLNSEATIFRRRYYNNGAHMGFILYTSDPNLTLEMENEIKDKIAQSKGLGNFRNMFINIPKGDPDGVKILPVGEVSAKDEFQNIKGITAQDIFTAHRFPAGLAGIIPTNGAVMGNPETARTTYRKDEVIPLQRKFMNGVNNDPEIPPRLHLNFDVELPVITADKGEK